MGERYLVQFDGTAAELEATLLRRRVFARVVGHLPDLEVFRLEIDGPPGLDLDTLLEDPNKEFGFDVARDSELQSLEIRRDETAPEKPAPAVLSGSAAGVTIALMDKSPIFAHGSTFSRLETFVREGQSGWARARTQAPAAESEDHGSRVASVAALAGPGAVIRGYQCTYVWDMMLALLDLAKIPSVVAVSACTLGPRPDRGPHDGAVELAAVARRVHAAGVTWVAAAGNEGPGGVISSPASFGTALAVGGADDRAPYGPDATDFVHPASSPGGAGTGKPDFLLSYTGYDYVISEKSYGRGFGTSLAAGRAAGLVAQLLARAARQRKLRPEEVKAHVQRHCVEVRGADGEYPAPRHQQGAGLLNEAAFLKGRIDGLD